MSDRSVTYIYASSSVASPNDPSLVSLVIPRGSLEAGIDQFLRLTFSQMTMQNNVYNIRTGSNQITVAGSVITLTPGFYPMHALAEYVNSLQSQVSFTFLPRQNKFQVTKLSASTSITVQFQGNLHVVFGFNGATQIVGASPLVSTSCTTPNTVTDLVVRITDMLIDPPTNLSNPTGNLLNTTNIFAVVPLRARPGCQNVFFNVNNAYTIDIFDTDPDMLTLFVTDAEGKAIDGLTHWTAVIKVDRMDRPSLDPKLFQLQSIAEYARLMFMQTALRDGVNDEAERFQMLREAYEIDNA